MSKTYPQVVSRLTEGFTYETVKLEDLGVTSDTVHGLLVTLKAKDGAVQTLHYSEAGKPVVMVRASDEDGLLEGEFAKQEGGDGATATPAEVTKKEFTALSEKVTKLEGEVAEATKEAKQATADAKAATEKYTTLEGRIAALESKE
ncbi:hypothetical protein [Proteus mirabilis]|uniref:hypothetical protein n=1 Tax=Proteus mirabilis TaxID=584 RepID=UPI0034D42AE3